jgi:hypothetical protein
MGQVRWLGLVIFWGASALPVLAQVKLEWKLKEGDNLYLEEKVALKQNVRLMKTDQIHERAFTRVTRFTVLKKNPDGGYLLEQKIESIKMDRAVATGKADGKMLRDQEGAVFKVTLTPNFKVAKLEGYESLVKRLGENEEIAKSIRILMPRAGFASATEAVFSYLPEKKVNKGDTWAQERVRPLGALGSLKIENTCTLKGPEKIDDREVVKIEIAPARSVYSLPQAEGEQSFKVTRGDLRADREKSGGTLYFSAALGRLVKSVTALQMTGTLTVSVMGTTLVMEIEHEEKITARMLDKDPRQ